MRGRSLSSYGRRRKKSIWGKLLITILVLISAIAYYIYTSPEFEREPPKIVAQDTVYADTKNSLKVIIEDNAGLDRYQAVFSNGIKNIVVASGRFDIPMKRSEIVIPYPKQLRDRSDQTKWKIIISVKDKSYWNRFKGNISVKRINIIADKEPPHIEVVAKSETMARGGSALVVFKAEDNNLKRVYIVSAGIKFRVKPYKKSGYFASLIAWPFKKRHNKIYIVAVDKSGNRAQKRVKFEKVLRHYKISRIALSDRFIDGKIVEVSKLDPKVSKITDRMKKFKAVNEYMRISNEKLIHKYSKKVSSISDSWKIKAFYPLKSAKLVADFGDERHYYYKDKSREVSLSYHVGYDMASVRHAPIVSSNSGKVVYASYNGIYGKMPLIDHGFGLYTLYGHCSRLLVKKGDDIEAGQKIARTGKTGLALGDHLHFGILVQGIEVWPMDWMKQNWIDKNINRVFSAADKIIGN